MNVALSILLCAPLIATGLAAQQQVQERHRAKVNSRRPVDASVEGLGEATRRAPGDTTRAGSIGLSARQTTESTFPLDCIARIADQATGSCLTASSTPTLGMLYPYPGLNNVFVTQAFVGGGEDNQATWLYSTIAGGLRNRASGYFATVGGGGANCAGSGGATVGGGFGNDSSGSSATVGGGDTNTASGDLATVSGGGGRYYSGGYYFGGNIASGSGATVGGGYNNTASGIYSSVGGGTINTASGLRATVGGGGGNTVSGSWATVGGGINNRASGNYATVGGGAGNTASGYRATLGGGRNNTASGFYATVGGGFNNDASGSRATVAGGGGNTAYGSFASVAGGGANTAQGDFSFAAGRRAKANHQGAFVWGDSVSNAPGPSPKTSSAADEFNVYASGGVRMFTNSAVTTGVLLAPGGSTWTMVSDRDAKENFEPVDARDVLDKVTELPLATWNYRDQDDSIRHMGPMAQDFYAAFGLGLGEKTIDTIDPNGIALAAIQGLNELVQDENAELKARLDKKGAEIEELHAANEALLARVERLEEVMHR